MNQKHKDTDGGAPISSWIPGNLITEISDTVQATGQTRSYVIAEAVRLGLKAVLRKYGVAKGTAKKGK